MVLSLVVLALLAVFPSRALVSLLRSAAVAAAVVFALAGDPATALAAVGAALFATAALAARGAYLRAGRGRATLHRVA